MTRSFARAIAALVCITASACSNGALPPESPGSTTPAVSFAQQLLAAPKRRLCPDALPGEFQCHGIVNELTIDIADRHKSCLHLPGCYAPSDLQTAYGIVRPAIYRGKSMTVALVDAYGYASAARDNARFRRVFRLPACQRSCFEVIGQTGGPPPAAQDPGWDFEQAIDVDMVSAICPNCRIVLVEATTPQTSDFVTAELTAFKLAHVVSNSWGGPEAYSSGGPFDHHPGIVVTASSGDSGAGSNFAGSQASAQQPCSFVGVVCVGGSSLVLRNGRRIHEVVWDDLIVRQCTSGPCATGSGCSSLVAKPSWQHDKGCTGRSETDLSADADPNTGVLVAYAGQFYSAGGTSVSSPMIAAMYALAGNTSAAAPARIWAAGANKRSGAFNPVTSGSNELGAVGTFVCGPAILYICEAGTGMNGTYSGPTGWGTPTGLSAL
ncbi:MAG: peptidase S8 [Candidatus Eremiobacteraeota bacterium]|nr:peptidase S8 [Candidatus Eremiobacteraeota bacterium]MBV8435682.1 peptidase S8 [Candidatus Eremiobacteraeota bacterium]MBV8656068.1 peptidase S8 [Candidatus Eremiobacteraeota bacterium]